MESMGCVELDVHGMTQTGEHAGGKSASGCGKAPAGQGGVPHPGHPRLYTGNRPAGFYPQPLPPSPKGRAN